VSIGVSIDKDQPMLNPDLVKQDVRQKTDEKLEATAGSL
jgi:hypothetical protein